MSCSIADRKVDAVVFCNMETFEASCGRNELLVMDAARYGRMSLGRCATVDYGNLGCSVDVREYMDLRCSGRPHCSMKVPDDRMYEMKPCPKDVTPFLEAFYHCQPITMPPECDPRGDTVLEGSSGTLSSQHTTRRCRWTVRVGKGQRVNVTLLDFGVAAQSGALVPGREVTGCQKYAVIREPLPGKEVVVCSGVVRHRNVYLSQTNEISLETFGVAETDETSARFILSYQTVGCPDPPITRGMFFTRHDDTAVVTCNSTAERLHLVCTEGRWVGHMPHCPLSEESIGGSWSILTALTSDWSSPTGLVIVISLGVGLGVVIGILLLLCVLAYYRRRTRRRLVGRDPYPDSHILGSAELDPPPGKSFLGRDSLGGGDTGTPGSPYYTDGQGQAYKWSTNNSFSQRKAVEAPACTCTGAPQGLHNISCRDDQRHLSGDGRHIPADHIYELPQ
nr:Gal-binding and CUB domains containing receptor 17 [Arenicola marina]